jgi:hypothetical protein
MNTFLPYADYAASAATLDRLRLGKQRVEVLQMLIALRAGPGAPWRAHAATRMWLGHERSLARYGLAVCSEWTRRGYRDTCAGKILDVAASFDACSAADPAWLGRADLHLAYRSNLVRKAPEHYRRLWPDVPDDLPYVWPVPLAAKLKLEEATS